MRRLNGALTMVFARSRSACASLASSRRRWVGSSDRVFSVFCTAIRALSMVRSALSTSLFDAVPLFESSPTCPARWARGAGCAGRSPARRGVFFPRVKVPGKLGPGLYHLQFVVDRVDAEQRNCLRDDLAVVQSRVESRSPRPATSRPPRRVPAAPRHSPGPGGAGPPPVHRRSVLHD